ncbi:MAG: hypothetical protein JSS64_12145 [Bacteroidetes bacterium]|nr:hypothetical protein [Bacteroidota bacterium]
MRILFVLLTLAGVFISCHKSSDVQKPEEISLPATLNGTVDYIDFENINDGVKYAGGVVTVKIADGTKYHFSFEYSDTSYYSIGNGQYLKGKMNSTVWFDTDSILLAKSVIGTPLVQASTLYTGLASPNAIHIKFTDDADPDLTKGAKTINATFTADSRLLVSFSRTLTGPNENDLWAKYEADRTLSINALDTIIRHFNHYNVDASLPPAPAWSFYSK